MTTASSLVGPSDSNSESSDSKLTDQQLLAALDAQIKFVTDSQRNEGLTRWAVWGALAALIWIATDLIASANLSMSRAVLAACGVFVIWTLLEDLIRILCPNSHMDVGLTRYRLITDILNALRPELTASVVRHLLILIALFYFQFVGLWLLWIYAGIALVFEVLFFVVGMNGFASPTKLNVGFALNIIPIANIAFLITASIQVASLMLPNMGSYTLADVRLALVFNAGSYLLIRLATATSSENLFNKLTQLRQDIAFGRLKPHAANQQVESLLSGLTLADVLNPSVAVTRKEFGELQPFLDNFQNLINQAEAKLTTLRTDDHELVQRGLVFSEAVRMIDELENQTAQIRRKWKGVTTARNRFEIGALLLAVYSPESRQEVKATVEVVRATYLEACKKIAECFQQHAALKMEANQLSQRNGVSEDL